MDNKTTWNETVVLIDSTYSDAVAFNLTVNFERMLNRRIQKADLAHWLDCVALDGGLREGDNNIDVVFLHPDEKKELDNFSPSDFENELNDKAFKDSLGEFNLYSFGNAKMTDFGEFFLETLQVIADAKEVKRLLVVGNTETSFEDIRNILKKVDGKECTLFGMQPLMPGNYRQEILGYSLMSALGISSEEIERAR